MPKANYTQKYGARLGARLQETEKIAKQRKMKRQATRKAGGGLTARNAGNRSKVGSVSGGGIKRGIKKVGSGAGMRQGRKRLGGRVRNVQGGQVAKSTARPAAKTMQMKPAPRQEEKSAPSRPRRKMGRGAY